MSIKARFGANLNATTSETSGKALGASRDAQRKETNSNLQLSETISGVAKAGKQVTETYLQYKGEESKQEINDNNVKLATLMGDTTFRDANATEQDSRLNTLIEDVALNSGKEARDAFIIKTGVMKGNIGAAAHEEVKVQDLSTITDDVSLFYMMDSGTTDKEGNPLNNYQAGKTLENFVDKYSERSGYSKTDISRAIMSGRQKTDITELSTARTTEDVDAIIAQNAKDNEELMKSIKFGASNSPEMKRQVIAYNKAINQKATALKSAFKKKAQSEIAEENQANGHPSVQYQYALAKEKYVEAYGVDKWEDKYNKDTQKQIIANEVRDIYVREGSDQEIDFGATKEEQAAHQEVVDINIETNMAVGNYEGASELIVKQGGYESKRIKNTKNTLMTGIHDPKLRTDTVESIVKLSSNAQSALFTDKKELAKILALNSFMKGGRPSDEAYDAVYNVPSGTLPTVISGRDKLKQNKLFDGVQGQMRADISTMFSSLVTIGTPLDIIVDTIEEYKESEPYSTKIPNLSKEADAVYTGYLESIGVPDGSMELVNNTYVVRDKYGIERYKVDKDKTLEAAFSANNVVKYWEDNPIESTFIKGLQGFNDWASTSMFDARRNQSYQGYYGHSVDYTEAPLPLKGEFLKLKDVILKSWTPKGKGRDTK